jgi:hypothetical protein
MNSHIFVLMMHMATGPGPPVDMPISAYETRERCLIVSALYAEDDQRNKLTGVTYKCAQVEFNLEGPKK